MYENTASGEVFEHRVCSSSSTWSISFYHHHHHHLKRNHLISIESLLRMFISLPVSSLLWCLSGNVCHSTLPPLARPTLGRTQPSPDPKALLPLHLLPGFSDVSTVSHCGCHSNSALPTCTLMPFLCYYYCYQKQNCSFYRTDFCLKRRS